MKKFQFILVLSLTLLLLGCEKLNMEEEPNPSNVEVFDHLWTTVDQKYSFFIDKDIDWEAAKRQFQPRARASSNSLELFNVLADMLFILEDGHVNLSAGIDLGRNWEWYLDYPPNFNFDLVERNYLVPSPYYQISGPLHNTIIDSVGYIYYESFSSSVSTSLMDYIKSKFKYSLEDEVAGLIIDIRDNGGGSISNAFTITNSFAGERIKVADWYYKKGPEHDDFTRPEEKFIEYEGNEDLVFNKPIVVLTNRSSYSSANFFASMMTFLPNVTIIGDQTGGGGGLPINNELPNGWRYRFSSTRTIDARGYNIEFGIAPDIKVDMDSADIAAGVDTIIERAISHIKGE